MAIAEITDRAAWDDYVSRSPWGHPLQLWGWGEVKRSSHWRPLRLALLDNEQWLAAVQVLLWPIPRTNWFVAYVPRGPVGGPTDSATRELMDGAAAWVKQLGAIYVRMEPAWTGEQLGWTGWRRAQHQIQMAQTYIIDLEKPEDELLNAIDGKYRYYLRKAERDGVTVRELPTGEIGDVFKIYEETAQRAGFGLHSEEYYRDLAGALGQFGHLLVAERDGRQVAFLWLAAAGQTAYELYGGVNQAGRDGRVNYLLKWRAIGQMKAAGYTIYDFNGRVSEGVSSFKQHFAPREVDYLGTWDRPLVPAAYHLWERFWPVIKRAGRLVRGGK